MCPRTPNPHSVEQGQGQKEKVSNEAISPKVQNSNKSRNSVSEFSLPSILEGLLVQIGMECAELALCYPAL